METLKGLICDVYAAKDGRECSNGGISSRVKEVTLVGEGIPEIFQVTEERPAVKLCKRIIGGKAYYNVRPYGWPDWIGMMGGAFIFSHDSRFPWDYPLALHDRLES